MLVSVQFSISRECNILLWFFHIYIRGPSPRQPFHKAFEKKITNVFPSLSFFWTCIFSEQFSFWYFICFECLPQLIYINVHLKRRSIKKVERKGKRTEKEINEFEKRCEFFNKRGLYDVEFSYAIWYKYNENKHFATGPIIVKAHKQRRIAGWPHLLQGWSWLLIDWKADTERNTQRWEDGQHFYVLSIGCQSRYCTYRCVRFTHIRDISCWHGNCFHLIIQHT